MLRLYSRDDTILKNNIIIITVNAVMTIDITTSVVNDNYIGYKGLI